MDNSNFPTASSESQPQPTNNLKNIVIGLLAFGLVGSIVYAIADSNKSDHVIAQQQMQIAKVNDDKSDVQKNFDASLARLDSMSGINNGLRNKLSDRNKEIDKKKAEIRSILNKKNATAAELSKAKILIGELNDNITNMEQQVAKLTQDNQSLTQDKVALTQDKEKLTSDLTTTTAVKEDLAKKVDIASTLNATNIMITPVDVKKNGKEKMTATAKRVNKLVISFDVNNRIAEPGQTDVYVVVTGPDGKPVMSQSKDSLGTTFTTREEGDKAYTAKLSVTLETNKTKNVQFSFAPGVNFEQGNYTIQIYQNGFKIGEGTRELKKAGLFS
jgi:septal ring factor EnvC (AmiA/AmiB activator)